MAVPTRLMFYIGLFVFAVGIIFLAYLLFTGPHQKIPETNIKVIYDHPGGIELTDIKRGDKLELSFESTEPVNVILMRKKDSGKYFNLDDRSIEHYDLAVDSTGEYMEHTFNSSATWKVYFENPNPPPKNVPRVKYWGQLIKVDQNPFPYIINIIISIILIIFGLAFAISSVIYQRVNKKKHKKGKKRAQKSKFGKNKVQNAN